MVYATLSFICSLHHFLLSLNTHSLYCVVRAPVPVGCCHTLPPSPSSTNTFTTLPLLCLKLKAAILQVTCEFCKETYKFEREEVMEEATDVEAAPLGLMREL